MRRLTLAAIVLALVAPACGGDGGDLGSGGTSSPTPTETGSPGGAPVELEGEVNDRGTVDRTADGERVELTIVADDFSFEPTFVKTTPGGVTVNVEIENEGGAPHTFTIDSLDVDEEIQPGAKTEVTFTLPDEDVTPFVCRFHVGQGMQGAFFSEEGSSSGGSGGTGGGGTDPY